MIIPFCGPTYNARSLNIDASRSINFYPELNPQDAKSVMALIGTPGTALWQTTGQNQVRGMHPFGGMLYVVAGGKLYSISSVGAISNALGTLATSTGRVCMKDNGLAVSGVGGNQLMVTDGAAGYIYNVNTAAFSQISGGAWPSAGASMVEYIDGYFVICTPGSMSVYSSNLYDGTTWDSLSTAQISAAPDAVQTIANIHQQLWFIKQYTSEVWYDAGIATSVGFPFQRMPGVVIDYGTPAPFSAARGDNSLFFLANQRNNDAGEFVGVVEISGYVPQVVSPPAVTYQMSQYRTMNDAFGYCYSAEGHTFYVITFPSGNATWVYDATTQMWHERSTWTGSPYAIGRHVSNCYANFNGLHLVGDWQNGNIYRMDSSLYTDNGNPLVSIRQAQHIADKQNLWNVFIHRLQIDMETGVGDDGQLLQTGIDPQAALSWSDDGGHTWSNEYPTSLGPAGSFKTRATWRRLGCSRDRVFRVAISDPVKRILIGAVAE